MGGGQQAPAQKKDPCRGMYDDGLGPVSRTSPGLFYLTECTSLVWVCSIAAFNIVTPKEFNDTPLVHYMHHSHSYRDTS